MANNYTYIAGRKTNSGAELDAALATSEATLQQYRESYNTTSTRNSGNAAAIISSVGDLVSGLGSAIGSIFTGVGTGKAIQSGNYYSQYNQGANNNINSSGTAIFFIVAIATVVLIVKK